jgi:hypothetical protein
MQMFDDAEGVPIEPKEILEICVYSFRKVFVFFSTTTSLECGSF